MELEDFTIPVTSKSNQLKGITFSEGDFKENSQAQKLFIYFYLRMKTLNNYLEVCQKYIKYGEEQGFNTGYVQLLVYNSIFRWVLRMRLL
ncbi:hypothetical protein KHA80_07475 [Anaerobacillus sp. HL2]|nr:hypothetical protein KHA80_07475 [Anaerobacillus sp. HL2]